MKQIIHITTINKKEIPLSRKWNKIICNKQIIANKYNSIDIEEARSEEYRLGEQEEYCKECIKEIANNDKY